MFSALNSIQHARWAALLLAPTLGRCGISLSVVSFPYARPAGLGRTIKDQARIRHGIAAVLTSTALMGVLAWQLRSLAEAIAFVCGAVVWWLGCRFVVRRIPGMTGDTYGAVNMLIEATVLLALAAQ
jgi:adenosylcobinamide-GDP ribazoletransferase